MTSISVEPYWINKEIKTTYKNKKKVILTNIRNDKYYKIETSVFNHKN